MNGYFDKTSTRLNFRFDALIVKNVIGVLFFTSMDDEEGDGEPIAMKNAHELFGQALERSYLVKIKNAYRLNLAL